MATAAMTTVKVSGPERKPSQIASKMKTAPNVTPKDFSAGAEGAWLRGEKSWCDAACSLLIRTLRPVTLGLPCGLTKNIAYVESDVHYRRLRKGRQGTQDEFAL